MRRARISRTIVGIGLFAIGVLGCADEPEVTVTASSSALTTRIVDGQIEVNVARSGYVTSSGDAGTQPRWTINDGRRGAPYDGGLGQYAFWASSTYATLYNCNYGNWWVRIDFNGTKSISEIDLFSLQDNYSNGADPTSTTTTTRYGNVDFHLSYCPEGVSCGASLDQGWVDAPGGYIYGNNKAWSSLKFAPVRASGIRASFDCGQVNRAYAVELEAWEQQAAPACTRLDPVPHRDNIYYVGDDTSTSALIDDADRFWWHYYGNFGDNDSNGVSDDVDTMSYWLSINGSQSLWWYYNDRATALVRMYDLLAPVDLPRAMLYLERLRQISNAFLSYRDDKRSPQPYDVVHQRVMPAWGANFDGIGWSAQATMSGLLTYPMAAFARRVSEHPEWFCDGYRADAIRFTTAVIETYLAFRTDIRFGDSRNAAWWYYVNRFDTQSPQRAEGYNEGLTPLLALAEIASAADSALYRSAPEWGWYNYYTAQEIPRLIAKNMKFFVDDIELASLADGTPWYWWHYTKDDARFPEDLPHARVTLGAVLSAWDNRAVLDGLLARNGYTERVAGTLNSSHITGIANTFLRRLWYYDSSDPNRQNLIADRIDGPNSNVYGSNAPIPSTGLIPDPNRNNQLRADNGNAWVGNFVELAQVNPWVWVRARDSVFNTALEELPGCTTGGEPPSGEKDCNFPALGAVAHASLLRYRGRTGLDPSDDVLWGGPGWAIWRTVNGGYLGGSSAAVSSDWSIAGTGDFDGDGSSDILWRNTDGRLLVYVMREAQFVSSISLGWLEPAWGIKGIADINGDNIADIVFQHSSSREIVTWLIGERARVMSTASLGVSSAGWTVSAMGDFNHDGKSDLFWTKRSGTAPIQTSIWLLDGATVAGYMTLSTPTIAYTYTLKGIGRLNDQYKDDLVWRNSNGQVITWLSTSTSGSVVNVSAISTGWPGTEWDLKTLADVNADGISDLVWLRSSDRRVETWLLSSSGGLGQSTLLGYTDPGWSMKGAGTFD